MQKNKYNFCGCTVELTCDEPLIEEGTFSLFRSDFDNADYCVRIIKTDTLPEAQGKPILISDRRKNYFDGKRQQYTAYYDITKKKYTDFALKTDDSLLYISYPGNLRELTVFDGLNLPDMLLKKGIGILHCSFIEYQGNAILFAGNKQTGKSTQAALWEKYKNAEIINGDRAALISENGNLFACGIPFCGTSKICKNKKLPLKAIICLLKGTENNIKKLSPMNAFMEMLSYFTYECRDKNASDAVSALASQIAETMPVYKYSCLNDESAVNHLIKELKR